MSEQAPSPADIRALRQRLGDTQEEFAQRIGCTVATVNRWERGRTHPTRLARQALAAHWQDAPASG